MPPTSPRRAIQPAAPPDGAQAHDFPLPPRALVGMIHTGPLPGTPGAPGAGPGAGHDAAAHLRALADRAAREARLLAEAGFDACIVENMHDAPYVHGRQGPEIVAAMTMIAAAARAAAPRLVMGIQVLSGGQHEALGIALAVGARFIRCENFVFAHVADEGLLTRAEAGPLLRYRRAIGAGHVRVFADIQKKHAAHALTADLDLAEHARAAEFFAADAVIVTGLATGRPTAPDDVARVRAATRLPLLVGSGVTPEDAPELLRHADALIVGSSIKHDGHWANPIDARRARALVRTVRRRS